MKNNKEKIKNVLKAFTSVGEQQQETEAAVENQEQPSNQDEASTELKEGERLIASIEDEELRAALRRKRMDGRGRPRKSADEKLGGKDYKRTSLIVNIKKYAKLKEIAFRETLTNKEILEAAIDLLINKYEEKNGKIIPHPEKYKGDVSKLFD